MLRMSFDGGASGGGGWSGSWGTSSSNSQTAIEELRSGLVSTSDRISKVYKYFNDYCGAVEKRLNIRINNAVDDYNKKITALRTTVQNNYNSLGGRITTNANNIKSANETSDKRWDIHNKHLDNLIAKDKVHETRMAKIEETSSNRYETHNKHLDNLIAKDKVHETRMVKIEETSSSRYETHNKHLDNLIAKDKVHETRMSGLQAQIDNVSTGGIVDTAIIAKISADIDKTKVFTELISTEIIILGKKLTSIETYLKSIDSIFKNFKTAYDTNVITNSENMKTLISDLKLILSLQQELILLLNKEPALAKDTLKFYLDNIKQLTSVLSSVNGLNDKITALTLVQKQILTEIKKDLILPETLNTFLNESLKYSLDMTKELKKISDYRNFLKDLGKVLDKSLKDAFGFDINQEAGTNFWDVLKEVIKSGMSIIETGLKEIAKNLKEILEFTLKLFDRIIELVVPKDTKFIDEAFQSLRKDFDVKFKFVANVSDSIISLFNTPQSQFKTKEFKVNAFGFQGQVPIDLSFFNELATYIKPITSGFFLLWFLIDLYKWFYSKGEIIE